MRTAVRSRNHAGIRRILLATDLSPASNEAADQALDLANDLAAELVILHVTDRSDLTGLRRRAASDGPGGSAAGDAHAGEAREEEARTLTTRARNVGIRTTFLAWEGEPGQAIVDAAWSEDVDLVVVGSHGRGTVGRLLLGSVSQHVVSNAGCPVLIARSGVRSRGPRSELRQGMSGTR
jgi:nucleotide-binding universal stress UspA family protein